MDPSDTLLIERVLQGDRTAFDELVARHRDQVERMLLRICTDREQAEDTAQETFVQAYRALHQFRGLSAFSTWLRRIAHNICLRKRQQARRMQQQSLEHLEAGDATQAPRQMTSPLPGPADVALQREWQQAVEQAIQDLPDSYRPVFILRGVQGMSTEEVSKTLGLTEAAVKARLHRARNFLKERLSPYLQS